MSRKTLLSPRPASGFTLVELMITLALGVIILTMAVPSFQSTLQNNRATTQANELLGALTLARSEAVKRNGSVSVCARSLSNPATCAGSADWATGWLVFTDGGTAGQLDGTDTLLREWSALAGAPVLTGSTQSDPPGALAFVQFRRTGGVQTAGIFTYSAAGCQGDQARQLNLALTGRAQVTRTPCP